MQSIYVGNLPYDATDVDLKSRFEQYGRVSRVDLMTDPLTGRSRGFGFVRMPSWEDAEEAIARLNGSDLRGRKMRVDCASGQKTSPSQPSVAKGPTLLDRVLGEEKVPADRRWN
ncbi:RNA recognition motif (RRM, RBD, or RNP domain) [Thalassoglobus neptunius]|uniref:RNA recognition motif (RRM, RBD, or RNP domain) n=1 Tax=Thalassoglobus neptunius TaxID=1938619 RepID=A0A5C5X7M1_9PLAN|nr:RNA-binding protein [Thalassoglobus neptunius]TWT59117.1 RNA recognition motif (RRM, RBD, or RNP domain) [Thalassoglobus neptunius]